MSSARDSELRLWPAIPIVALQWVAVFGFGLVAPGTFLHFFGMWLGPMVGSLLLALWWLFFSRARWPSRLGGLVLCVVGFIVATWLAHPSATMAMFVYGLPVLCAAVVVWGLMTRDLAPGARRLGLIVTVAAVCVGGTLVRTDGVDGALSVDFAWRWSPTAEERFLETASADPQRVPAGQIAAPDAGPRVHWAGFRGPERHGRVAGLTIETDWERRAPTEIWRRGVGPGWSSFAVVGERLFTQEQRGDDEIVAAYDTRTGEPLWFHRDPVRFWEALAGAGPRATPTWHDGRIFAFGATGILNCLDAADGSVVWSRNAGEDTGAATPEWGFAASPLIVGELVLVHTGGPDGRAVVAYDTASGEPRWYAPSGAVSYCSPQLATIDGVAQVLILTDAGATSLDPADGRVLWDHSWQLEGGSRIVQPGVTADGGVLIGTGFGMGTRLIRPSRDGETWRVEERWTSRALKPYYNDFVIHDGYAYGFDGSILAAVDLADGTRAWKGGRYGNGQVLLVADQGLLLVLSERGELVLVAADPSGLDELARMPALTGKTWNHPAIADGVLYVRNGEEMAAFRLPVVERDVERSAQ